jgi:hypothetical protein
MFFDNQDDDYLLDNEPLSKPINSISHIRTNNSLDQYHDSIKTDHIQTNEHHNLETMENYKRSYLNKYISFKDSYSGFCWE